MITSWPYTVTHDDMDDNVPTSNTIGGPTASGLAAWTFAFGLPGVLGYWFLGGGQPDVHYGSVWLNEVALYNGQPGLITQDVSHGSSQAFQGMARWR